MSNFRHRGLETVVDTLIEAEFDFASRQISQSTQEIIALRLKTIARSLEDRVYGDIRLREIEGWDVCYTVAWDGTERVVIIVGVDSPGEMENHFETLLRAGKSTLPAPLRELLKGRMRK